MNKTLTVFTPAYNRAHTIGRTFESLCRQTSQDFEWLIIDDGSSDSTRRLVESWLSDIKKDGENNMEGYSEKAPWLKVRYIYQKNQGMHGAHNTAYENIDTELNTCIDSDDYMPDNAVEKITGFWKNLSEDTRTKYAGIIGLDIDDKNKEIIGTSFPKGVRSTTLKGFYDRGGRGDKKLVYRTDLIKSVPPYPVFEGERYVGLNYKYGLIDRNYELLVLNEPLVIVDYQSDGSSASMYRQYWNNPKGWSFYRKYEMQNTTNLKRKFIVCAHYVSSSIRCRNKMFLKESPEKLLTVCAIPFGILIYFKTKLEVVKSKVKA